MFTIFSAAGISLSSLIHFAGAIYHTETVRCPGATGKGMTIFFI